MTTLDYNRDVIVQVQDGYGSTGDKMPTIAIAKMNGAEDTFGILHPYASVNSIVEGDCENGKLWTALMVWQGTEEELLGFARNMTRVGLGNRISEGDVDFYLWSNLYRGFMNWSSLVVEKDIRMGDDVWEGGQILIWM
jgi:hypothetical protein